MDQKLSGKAEKQRGQTAIHKNTPSRNCEWKFYKRSKRKNKTNLSLMTEKMEENNPSASVSESRSFDYDSAKWSDGLEEQHQKKHKTSVNVCIPVTRAGLHCKGLFTKY